MNWGAIVSGITAVLGSASVLSGVVCAISHISGGDLGSHWHDCLALIAAGTATASPGVNALKVGPFARPKPQRTVDPLSGERR